MALSVKFYYSACTQCDVFNLFGVHWMECASNFKFLPHQMYQWVRNVLKFHLFTDIYLFFNIFTIKEVGHLALFEPIFTRLLKFEVQSFKPWTNYCLLVCSNSFVSGTFFSCISFFLISSSIWANSSTGSYFTRCSVGLVYYYQ